MRSMPGMWKSVLGLGLVVSAGCAVEPTSEAVSAVSAPYADAVMPPISAWDYSKPPATGASQRYVTWDDAANPGYSIAAVADTEKGTLPWVVRMPTSELYLFGYDAGDYGQLDIHHPPPPPPPVGDGGAVFALNVAYMVQVDVHAALEATGYKNAVMPPIAAWDHSMPPTAGASQRYVTWDDPEKPGYTIAVLADPGKGYIVKAYEVATSDLGLFVAYTTYNGSQADITHPTPPTPPKGNGGAVFALNFASEVQAAIPAAIKLGYTYQ